MMCRASKSPLQCIVRPFFLWILADVYIYNFT